MCVCLCVCVLVIQCCVTNYPQTQMLKTINISYLKQFLWVRNPRQAHLGGSDLGSLMRLQSRCWPGLQSSEGLTRLGDPLPKRPTRNADDRKSQSLTSCCQKALVHCHVNLSIGLCDELRKWQLTSPRVGDPTKQGRSCNIFHYLALEVISTICYWLQRSALFNMEGDCIIVELLGFILEPGYYTHLSFKVYLFNSVFYSSKLLNYLNEQSLLAITILSLFAVTQCWQSCTPFLKGAKHFIVPLRCNSKSDYCFQGTPSTL